MASLALSWHDEFCFLEKPMNTFFSRLALLMTAIFLAGPSLAAQSMTEPQAKAYFSSASLMAQGSLDGLKEVAVVMPNPNPNANTSRIEVWRLVDKGYELIASAPKAGCQDCSGPTHKPNPSRIGMANGSLEVEYQGGGSGLGFWAWRSSWSWDPTLGSLRALATQRIGSDEQGDARHALVNFVDGSRAQRLMDGPSVKATVCRAAITRAPTFAMLSLPALFDGTMEPECQSGTESGDPLAASPSLGSSALDNMMRSSSAKSR
jgi:hypothetical protein